jgi:hypothetical protein
MLITRTNATNFSTIRLTKEGTQPQRQASPLANKTADLNFLKYAPRPEALNAPALASAGVPTSTGMPQDQSTGSDGPATGTLPNSTMRAEMTGRSIANNAISGLAGLAFGAIAGPVGGAVAGFVVANMLDAATEHTPVPFGSAGVGDGDGGVPLPGGTSSSGGCGDPQDGGVSGSDGGSDGGGSGGGGGEMRAMRGMEDPGAGAPQGVISLTAGASLRAVAQANRFGGVTDPSDSAAANSFFGQMDSANTTFGLSGMTSAGFPSPSFDPGMTGDPRIGGATDPADSDPDRRHWR